MLRMRFGIGMNTDHTLEEVGQQFSVTRERIRQIEAKALRKLKHPSRSRKMRSLLDQKRHGVPPAGSARPESNSPLFDSGQKCPSRPAILLGGGTGTKLALIVAVSGCLFSCSKGRPMIEPSAALSSSTRRVVLAAIAALSSPMLLTPAPALAAGTAESSEQLHFVVLLPGDRGSTINGSTDDWRRARSFRTGSDGLVYVRLHGVDYVIRDASMLRRAESIFEPQAK